jgi:hypothetical protein
MLFVSAIPLSRVPLKKKTERGGLLGQQDVILQKLDSR